MAALQTPEFWVAIGFLILMGIIARPGWKAITTGLDARTDAIASSLDEAAKLREEAQHLLAEYQRKQRDTAKEVDDLLAAARSEAQRLAADASQQLEESLARREQLALDKITQAEADAMQAVRDTAIDIAMAATRNILATRMNEATAARQIDDAIAELPNLLH
jgi:F-type H+-transporting ATPase subunit b